MKKMILFFTSLSSILTAQLFINEIDYDQPGTDASEFLELSGPAGSYSDVNLVLINGNNNSSKTKEEITSIVNGDIVNGNDNYIIKHSWIL